MVLKKIMQKNTLQTEEQSRKKICATLKKASGILSKVSKMAEDGHYCIDVMQQNLAVIGLLRSSHKMLMENHLRNCFKSAVSSSDEKKKNKMTEEILKVMNMYNK